MIAENAALTIRLNNHAGMCRMYINMSTRIEILMPFNRNK